MRDYQGVRDHRIADAEQGALRFTDGTQTGIADWEITESAPDVHGRIYRTLRGWATNVTGSNTLGDSHYVPFPNGPAHLFRADLRGHPQFADLNVDCSTHSVGRPYPHTWDHPGYLLQMTWLARTLNPDGELTAPAWWPAVLDCARELDQEAARILEYARPVNDSGSLLLRLPAEQASQLSHHQGTTLVRDALKAYGRRRAATCSAPSLVTWVQLTSPDQPTA
ncbi:hypothetical protein AB0M58_13810 [Streptomyces bobili]|uniref:hypothetical protein n=1 Tax=Streptomyces bobili TaxID=67280 RepID=UPI003433B70D